MIAYVTGTLVEKTPAKITVEACGVGYEMFVSLATYDRLPATGSQVKVLAWHSVREDAETLYGFATAGERDMFAKLTAVSGVGPKIALAILSGLSVGDLSLAISSGESKRIATVKGVGRKTAEKICVELKDKVNAFEAMSAASGGAADGAGDRSVLRDAVLALAALGYGDENATKMAAQAAAAHPGTEDAQTLVRYALSGR